MFFSLPPQPDWRFCLGTFRRGFFLKHLRIAFHCFLWNGFERTSRSMRLAIHLFCMHQSRNPLYFCMGCAGKALATTNRRQTRVWWVYNQLNSQHTLSRQINIHDCWSGRSTAALRPPSKTKSWVNLHVRNDSVRVHSRATTQRPPLLPPSTHRPRHSGSVSPYSVYLPSLSLPLLAPLHHQPCFTSASSLYVLSVYLLHPLVLSLPITPPLYLQSLFFTSSFSALSLSSSPYPPPPELHLGCKRERWTKTAY